MQSNITAATNGSILTLNKDYECEDGFDSKGITINQSITIDGQGHKIDAQGKSRIFKINAGNVVLKNIYFINGTTTMQGGAVCFDKSGTVSDCNFTNNKATYVAAYGGAIYMDSGSVTNCNFVNNYAEHRGGAIYIMKDAEMSNCNFTGNTAMNGGAVYFDSDSYITAADCNFINNNATGDGGAFWMRSGSIKNCNFTDNSAKYGGAVYSEENESLEIKSCNFINNSAVENGGAVFVYNEGNFTDCNFTNNSADWGGAVILESGSLRDCDFVNNYAYHNGGALFFFVGGNVTDCDFTNNNASEKGGAVYFSKACSNSKVKSTFINNSANNGGAIHFNNDTDNVAINSYFEGNVAERAGGAIYVRGNSSNSTFSSEFYGNEAKNASGGAIFFYNLALNNSFEGYFDNNYALYGGAIFFYKNANDNEFNAVFSFNVAKSCGGAIFFYNTTNNNTFNGIFINNSALGELDETVGNGGAITFKDVSTNCLFTCNFINNTAALNGGGVNYRQTPHNITFNGNFINNTSPKGGGVNFFESFENVVFNGEFIANSAKYGGAIATVNGIIEDVSFKNNHADYGGAVYIYNNGSVKNCTFINNTADYGGAVYLNNYSGVINCSFNNNSATVHGGAVDIYSGNIEACSFNSNTVSTLGGAVYSYAQSNISNCNFTDNKADHSGGALGINGDSKVSNSSFEDNEAGDGSNDIVTSNNAIVTLENVSPENLTPLTFVTLDISVNNVTYPNTVEIKVSVKENLKELNEGSVYAVINNQTYTADVVNGTAAIKISGLGTGDYNDVKVTYNGSEKYTNSFQLAKFSVENPYPVANATLSLETEDESSVVATVKDLDGNALANASLTAIVDGVESNITTDSEGKAVIPIGGNATVEVKYADPLNNATISTSMSVKVIVDVVEKIVEVVPNRTATQLIYSDMNTTSVDYLLDGRIGKYFEVTLKDINGNILANKKVQIGFNGKVYNRTTNETGGVRLQINLKQAGRYTFAISFLGDDNYTGIFEVALITVSVQKPVLSTASKTYKASAKTKTLSATLKSARGNPIKGQKLTFTVNGKSYTATTNAKGIASVKVSLSKKGTYSFTVKNTKGTVYSAVSKSGKLTIK